MPYIRYINKIVRNKKEEGGMYKNSEMIHGKINTDSKRNCMDETNQ